MIEDATALALRVAPCLKNPDLDEDDFKYAKAIIRGALARWIEQGLGGVTMLSADVFGMRFGTQPQARMGIAFLRTEIKDLKSICGTGGAYSIDMGPHEPPPWMEFVDP